MINTTYTLHIHLNSTCTLELVRVYYFLNALSPPIKSDLKDITRRVISFPNLLSTSTCYLIPVENSCFVISIMLYDVKD